MDEWKKKVAAMKAAREMRAPPTAASSSTSPAITVSTATTVSPSSPTSSSSSSSSSSHRSPSIAKLLRGNKLSSSTNNTSSSSSASPATLSSKTTSSPNLQRPSSVVPPSAIASTTPVRSSFVPPSSSSSSATPPSASTIEEWKTLYEDEVKKRESAEQERERKEKEIQTLREKVVSLAGTDMAKQVVAGGGNLTRELNIVKTELRVVQMKLDTEVKKREHLEQQMEQKQREIDDLKKKGTAAKQMVDRSRREADRKRQEVQAQRMKVQAERMATERRMSPSTGNSFSANSPNSLTPNSGPNTQRTSVRASVRASRRMTKKPSQGPNIVQMVTRVLQEMERLEKSIKKAEEGRMQAEAELVEVAMYKQTSDEALDALANDIKLQMVFLSQHVHALRAASDLSGMLQIADKVEKTKVDIENRLDERNIRKSAPSSAEVNKRASVYATRLNLPPPPPSGGITIQLTDYSNANRVSKKVQPSALLEQIRQGKNLNRIDVEAINQQRANKVTSNRKSMMLLSSLQETLKAALDSRREDINDDYDDYDEDEWEEWNDESEA